MAKKLFIILPILFLLSYLLLCPREAVVASANGLLLWFYTLLPTLLPFMILTNLVNVMRLSDSIVYVLKPILQPLFKISKNGCFILLMGLLCGFPMGGKLCGDFVRQGRISIKEAQYLLTISNMASPAFILSYIFMSSLHIENEIGKYLLCIYLPLFLWAIVARYFFYPDQFILQKDNLSVTDLPKINFKIIDQCIMDAFAVITKLGGYLILFSILSSLLQKVPFLSLPAKNIMILFTEITNGTRVIMDTSISTPVKTVLVLTAVNFGGLSFLAQTASMIKDTGLSMKIYIKEKAIISIMTAFLSYILFI
ncbi:MAG: transporter [Lachnospiraceae bacterium]|nr:transporter [Lachnospiraceae bacterium]